jgi:hypothetical protein
LGLRCIKLPAPSTSGVCQLPGEETCTEGSCESPLACFDGGCLLPCDATNTCIAGETCESGQCTLPETGVLCTHNSNCEYPEICLREQCGRECATSDDCDVGDCVQLEICDAPCACRPACAGGCPTGTTCVASGDYCELDDPTGMGMGG